MKRQNRLKEIINTYTNGNQSEFARMLNVEQNVVANWLGRGFGELIVNKIISVFPDINPTWLLTGEGAMLKSDKNKVEEAREIDPDYMDVELVSKYAYAGYMSGYGDAEYIEMLPKIKVITDRTVHGNYKCFEVKGDSMFDNSFESWLDGDIVLCREVQRHLWLPKLHINKCDFVIVHKEGIIIKRIIEQDNNDGSITVHSLNPDKSAYPDTKLYMNDIMQIFAVVKLVDRVARR